MDKVQAKRIKKSKKNYKSIIYILPVFLVGVIIITVACAFLKSVALFILLALGTLLVLVSVGFMIVRYLYQRTTDTTNMLKRMEELSKNDNLSEAELDEQISLSELMNKKTKKQSQGSAPKYD
jgi:amino acid permease